MGRQRPEPEVEMEFQIAPMINLMLVIIAAMTTTLGVLQKELELGIKVPGQESSTSTPTDTPIPIEIGILKDGRILYNKTAVDNATSSDLPDLKARLSRATEFDNEQQVIIRPQLDARHNRIVDVLNACTASGVKKLTFGEAR
ncbi:MAG: biopolymer transporter ExbD [Verrucomicrobiota bacterium]